MAQKITLNQIGVMIEAVDGKVSALGEGQKALEERLNKRIDLVHTSLKNEIKSTFYALNDKLEEHIKQPSHV